MQRTSPVPSPSPSPSSGIQPGLAVAALLPRGQKPFGGSQAMTGLSDASSLPRPPPAKELPSLLSRGFSLSAPPAQLSLPQLPGESVASLGSGLPREAGPLGIFPTVPGLLSARLSLPPRLQATPCARRLSCGPLKSGTRGRRFALHCGVTFSLLSREQPGALMGRRGWRGRGLSGVWQLQNSLKPQLRHLMVQRQPQQSGH